MIEMRKVYDWLEMAR